MFDEIIEESYKILLKTAKTKPNLSGYSIWTKFRISLSRYKLILYIWFRHKRYKIGL